jgi:hypothetical protein
MMISERLLLLSILCLLSNSCQNTLPYPPPITETCIIAHEENGKRFLICEDARRPIPGEIYDIDFNLSTGYVCTNPVDFNSLTQYNLDLREKLQKCEHGKR